MKITNIYIENVLGVSRIDTALSTPVALFAGDNYAGKSSIREAIKAAFLGVSERVLKKKDFGQLVHDASEAGSAAVDFEGGTAIFTAPDGKIQLKHSYTMDVWEAMALALPYCLDTQRFARVSSDDRRSLLFAITGASAKTSDIVASLKARGLEDKFVETVTPLLRSGFLAAMAFAEGKARDAKSDWKAITHETYGHVKAETWSAPVPAGVDATAIEQLASRAETLKGKIGTEQTRLGAAEQKLKAWLIHDGNAEADRKTFGKLASLEKKLAQEEDDLLGWSDKVKALEGQAGTGPRVGLVHDLARGVWHLIGAYQPEGAPPPDTVAAHKALAAYCELYGRLDSEGDPEAAAKLPAAREARDLMQRCANNTRRDIDAAKAAGARLGQKIERGSEEEVAGIETILAGYKKELGEVNTELTGLQTNQRAAEAARHHTANAKVHHEAVKQWQVAIDALSPDGIPAEILAKALVPLNATLAELSITFGWARVQVDADMMITSGVRPYALQSESEKWRTDAILALAIARISSLRFAAFDRVDVLNLAGRADFIDGIDRLAEQHFIDSALIFGTFKKLPTLGAFPQVTGYWVENGTIAAQPEAIREAA